jgi:hypothetical protein
MIGDPVCRHCFGAPPCNRLGLCAACFGSPQVRRLYVCRRKGWGLAWERRIDELSQRAFLRLPLFPMEPFDEAPRPGAGSKWSRRKALYLSRRAGRWFWKLPSTIR